MEMKNIDKIIAQANSLGDRDKIVRWPRPTEYPAGVSEEVPEYSNRGYPGQEGLKGRQDSYKQHQFEGEMLRYERPIPEEGFVDPNFDEERFNSTMMRNTPGREPKQKQSDYLRQLLVKMMDNGWLDKGRLKESLGDTSDMYNQKYDKFKNSPSLQERINKWNQR